MFQQMTQIATGRFDLSGVPKAVRPAIVRCLSRRPKDRPKPPSSPRDGGGFAGACVPGPSRWPSWRPPRWR